MDKDDFNLLNDVFKKMKQEQAQYQLRKAKRVWQSISFPITFSEILERLTKDDLTHICRHYELRKLSTLRKKDLIAELVKILPKKVHEEMISLDEDRYTLLKHFIKHNEPTVIKAEEFELEEVEYWQATGLIFPGTWKDTKILLMPMEIFNAFKQLDQEKLQKISQRNTEWILLTQGMLFYYGALSYHQILKQIKDLLGAEPDYFDLFHVLLRAKDYYELLQMNRYGTWAYCEVTDIENVRKEHQARPDVEYQKFSKSKLLKAGQPDYRDENFAFRRFTEFLLNAYNMTEDKAKDITEECQTIIKQDIRVNKVIEFLQTRLEFPSFEFVQELTEHVVDLSNHTRQWILKGHTPDELFEVEKEFLKPLPALPYQPPHSLTAPFALPPEEVKAMQQTETKSNIIDMKTRKKVGRNDPCPCGSGKKFKHCCGRN
ncbi:SEC-C metal-binding domain-containing protein [Desulfitobacterium sp.]|uniref:SEC-C metal-binding domain-containing protein n=1 Tax=Desulfitobacterium sp. TaxID=49981 RepID=UPI002B1F95C3|nr:SEC-C metal-binding domain-containing protein [Desulfitobacterium sp.]MEA4902550.1 SEC-C metal-binding domain-containing protein [Desulfitobacterium sp.]